MALIETLIVYCVAGLAVSVAVFISQPDAAGLRRLLQPAAAVVFWPLYVPLLLARRGAALVDTPPPRAPEPLDSMGAAIEQVETELASALTSLDGWAEDVLAREKGRIEELLRAWRAQAARIRAMDSALSDQEARRRGPAAELLGASERLRRSAESRERNLAKLREVRRRAHEDLTGTLAWVRELVSMIQLAKFTGAPATRAGELVAQIAASVEGLSEVGEWAEREDRAGAA